MAGMSFDRVADSYDATRRLPDSVMAGAVDALVEVLGAEGPVLEAGVGTGRFAVPLRSRGVRVVGIDIAPRMVAAARGKGAHDLFLASATCLPFRDASFRSSYAIHVLHLVEDWRGILHEAARVTRGLFLTLLETITTRRIGGESSVAHGDAVAYPMPRYQELASERGHGYRHPGVRPSDLVPRVPPSLQRRVGAQTLAFTAEQLLEPIAAKTHSSQWGVPDAVHEEIMAALRREVEGSRFARTWDVELIGWAAEELRRF